MEGKAREKAGGLRIVNLVENTPGAAGCGWAHGLSFYIETPRHKLLMDTGPSPLMVENARALGVDLGAVDAVVISHGHYDHADGLPAFAALNPRARVYLRRGAEGAFYSVDGGDGSPHYIGMAPGIAALPQAVWVEGDLAIDDELYLFGDIAGRRAWPEGNRRLLERRGGRLEQDRFAHEQCLVVRAGGKRTLFSGCAHSGILNILERCRECLGAAPDAVVSGFHMKKSADYTEGEAETIRATARALQAWPCRFYTCHCTGLPAFDMMKEIMGDQLRYVHCGEAVDLDS